MKLALAAIGNLNGDIEYNKNKILETIFLYAKKVDLILFGETFLQGFDSLSWNYNIDKNIAISKNDINIIEIMNASKENHVGVSFGYIEKDDDSIYSSQITIDKNGKIINNYRRVSNGWKEKCADFHYKEGTGFEVFEFEEKKIVVGLCGDFWHEENIEKMNNLNKDLIFWPVYTEFNYDEWCNDIKYDYAKQALKFKKPTLYVNSLPLNILDEKIAKGGAALFENGLIIEELLPGKEEILIVEI